MGTIGDAAYKRGDDEDLDVGVRISRVLATRLHGLAWPFQRNAHVGLADGGEPNSIAYVEEPYVLAAAIALLREERGIDVADVAQQVAIPMDLMNAFVVEPRPRLRVTPT